MNWLRYKYLYFAFSLSLIIISVYSLFLIRVKPGVEFIGGTVIEYDFEDSISSEELTSLIESGGIETISIQETDQGTYFIKLPPLTSQEKTSLNELIADNYEEDRFEELRFETVGPSIGPELIKKTLYAILIAVSSILVWVAYQFKSIKFGASAVLAMLHDTFVLIGVYTLLGNFYDAEADFLFVTAVLTTLSFSVHDTIVVFDRIREISKTNPDDLKVIANKALTETMVRSLNNSFTIIFMLISLILLGGTTVKWFAMALLIGTVLGTYSSPFVAVPLLVTFDNLRAKNFTVFKKFKK